MCTMHMSGNGYKMNGFQWIDHSSTIDKLKSRIEQLESLSEQLDQSVDYWCSQVRKLSDNITMKSDDLIIKDSAIQSLKEKNKNLEIQLIDLRNKLGWRWAGSEFGPIIDELKSENDNLKRKVESSEQGCNYWWDRYFQLTKQALQNNFGPLITPETDIQSLKRKNARLTVENKELSHQLNVMRGELENAEEARDLYFGLYGAKSIYLCPHLTVEDCSGSDLNLISIKSYESKCKSCKEFFRALGV